MKILNDEKDEGGRRLVVILLHRKVCVCNCPPSRKASTKRRKAKECGRQKDEYTVQELLERSEAIEYGKRNMKVCNN